MQLLIKSSPYLTSRNVLLTVCLDRKLILRRFNYQCMICTTVWVTEEHFAFVEGWVLTLSTWLNPPGNSASSRVTAPDTRILYKHPSQGTSRLWFWAQSNVSWPYASDTEQFWKWLSKDVSSCFESKAICDLEKKKIKERLKKKSKKKSSRFTWIINHSANKTAWWSRGEIFQTTV